MTISPDTATGGTNVTLTVTGFPPNSTVSFAIRGGVLLSWYTYGSTTTDQNGAYTVSGPLDPSVSDHPGLYTIRATSGSITATDTIRIN